jgi:hypothetical protein
MKIHPKRLGTLAEIAFVFRCLALGLIVTAPYGDCDPFVLHCLLAHHSPHAARPGP